MAVEVITKEDLEDFRLKLLADIKALLPKEETKGKKQWLRSKDVMEMLDISMGTLQNLCGNGILHPSKVGGLNYFKSEEIQDILDGKHETNGIPPNPLFRRDKRIKG